MLPVVDAQLLYEPEFIDPTQADELLTSLSKELAWQQDHITLFGKTHPQPRLHAWYGDADCSYTYSGLKLQPLPWIPRLAMLRDQLNRHIPNAAFNSVLANLYRDGRDSMGMHADDEPELGSTPVIASLSFGAQRTLVMKHRHLKTQPTQRIPLAHGSLLVMRGNTQANWKHGLNKTQRPVAPRVNLTFRQIMPRAQAATRLAQ